MICFTVLKEFVLMCSLSSVSQPPCWSLVVLIDMRRQCCHNSFQTTRPFSGFIYLEGMAGLSPAVNLAVIREYHAERNQNYLVPFLASLLSSLQLLSLRSTVFFASTHGVAGKARHSFVWLGGTGAADDSHRAGAASCCHSCPAVPLICGNSRSLAAFRVCTDIDGGWIDSGR